MVSGPGNVPCLTCAPDKIVVMWLVVSPPDPSSYVTTNSELCAFAHVAYALAPAPYDVHLAGLRLRVRGIPFQQQEQAVGACATTAIWSALARVMRSDGGRAPTPFAVTEAATKHYVSDRAFPAAAGLEPRQILEAALACFHDEALFCVQTAFTRHSGKAEIRRMFEDFFAGYQTIVHKDFTCTFPGRLLPRWSR